MTSTLRRTSSAASAGQAFVIAFGCPIFDGDGFAFHISELVKPLFENLKVLIARGRDRAVMHVSDALHRRRLLCECKRNREHSRTEDNQQLATIIPHAPCFLTE